jgi:hypothetical protein
LRAIFIGDAIHTYHYPPLFGRGIPHGLHKRAENETKEKELQMKGEYLISACVVARVVPGVQQTLELLVV